MKKLYCLLIIGACLEHRAAEAQQWRPFRANQDVHAFRGASTDTVFTMRLDSAALQGTDSVYYFNRTMRRTLNSNGYSWQKSRNNKLGKLMRYDRATRTYSLYWDGGPVTSNLLDKSLVIKPFARVGDTWSSYFTDYGVTTTLVSRGTQVLDGVTDSVATFRCSTGATVVLSKNNGLVSAPVDLLFGVANAKTLTLARRPAPAGQTYYNPLALLDLQPGNELGYYREPLIYSTFACYTGQLLRRILTRQVTVDSLIYTFQEQSTITYSTAPGCYGTGIPTVMPVQVGRLAASRHSGKWAGGSGSNSRLIPAAADLLAYEYRTVPGSPSRVLLGYPVITTVSGSGSCSAPALLQQQELYRSGDGSYYEYPTIDAPGWAQRIGPGIGITRQSEQQLTYFRRTVNGIDQTCGSRTSFGTLLPTKPAQRAAGFQAFPNPTTEQVQLRLEAPAEDGSRILVQDALGRFIVSVPLTVGQTTLTLYLRDQPTGLYLVQLLTTTGASQAIRVQKLP